MNELVSHHRVVSDVPRDTQTSAFDSVPCCRTPDTDAAPSPTTLSSRCVDCDPELVNEPLGPRESPMLHSTDPSHQLSGAAIVGVGSPAAKAVCLLRTQRRALHQLGPARWSGPLQVRQMVCRVYTPGRRLEMRVPMWWLRSTRLQLRSCTQYS